MNIKKILSIIAILFSIVNIVLCINLFKEKTVLSIYTNSIIIIIIIQILSIIISIIIFKNSKSKIKSNLLMVLLIIIMIIIYFIPVKVIDREPLYSKNSNIPIELQCLEIITQNLYNIDL